MTNFEKIIQHQANLIAKEMGQSFKQLSAVEQYRIKYEVALALLEELG
jgi:hypothetical protein